MLMWQGESTGRDKIYAQWFGVSTLLIGDGETSVMVDGFFSRPSWFNLITRIEPDEQRIRSALRLGCVDKVDAVFVSHSHYDHAMDSPTVATITGAVLIGSQSTRNIALGQNFDMTLFQSKRTTDPYIIGKFRLYCYDTPHSPDSHFKGTIDQPLYTPARASRYRQAENYSYRISHGDTNILIIPSASFVPGRFRDVKADIVFLSIGTLGKQSIDFIDAYWNEIVTTVGAKIVIPIHWDNFGRSLDKPIKPLPYLMDNMKTAMDRLLVLSQRDGVAIRFLPLFDRHKIR
jgi:L-ascorbate metabolism protein UlaG (beta-lactamase superfamily)